MDTINHSDLSNYESNSLSVSDESDLAEENVLTGLSNGKIDARRRLEELLEQRRLLKELEDF
jgi:hypothetical protein